MKQVPACEYNPFEAVQTNVLGAQHVVDCAIDAGVKQVVALSTDKAVNPVNLYGATKLCEEKIIVQGNAYAAAFDTRLSCVRYGNVVGSRGSVVPLFKEQLKTGKLTITDERMTRFWITLPEAVDLVLFAMEQRQGGRDLHPQDPVDADDRPGRGHGPRCPHRDHRHPARREAARGPAHRRRGPPRHRDRATSTSSCPSTPGGPPSTRWIEGKPLDDDFVYASNTNDWWLTSDELQQRIVA